MASRQIRLEYLTTTKIGEKGQLTGPKEFSRGSWVPGRRSAALRLGDGLVLLPSNNDSISSATR